MFYDAVQTSDGGYILAGATDGLGAGGSDAWLVKTDSSGNIQWQKAYGGSADDIALSVIETAAGGFVFTGQTESFGRGDTDVWVVKTDASGNIVWEHAYGGANKDEAHEVIELASGDLVVAGQTSSFGAGLSDLYVLRLNALGQLPATCQAGPASTAQVTVTNAQVGTYNMVAQNVGPSKAPKAASSTSVTLVSQDQCPSNCGDSITQYGETCDASVGTVAAQCPTPDPGRSCSANCQQCQSYCGNGIVEATEQCDDGNQANGDQCSSTCQWEDNDGDGVYDVEEVQIGADPFDADSYPAYVRVDAYGHVRVSVTQYGSGQGYQDISRNPRISAQIRNLVDQDGNPVAVYNRQTFFNPAKYTSVSYLPSGGAYVIHKTPTLTSLQGDATAIQRVSTTQNNQQREVRRIVRLDMRDAPPVSAGPSSAVTTSVTLGVQIYVYNYNTFGNNAITGNVVDDTIAVPEEGAYPGMEPSTSEAEPTQEPGVLAPCCMFEDTESPTGYSWNMTDGTKAIVEVLAVGKKVVSGSELNIYTPLEYPLQSGENTVVISFDTYDDFWIVGSDVQLPDGCVLISSTTAITVDSAPAALVMHISCDASANLITGMATRGKNGIHVTHVAQDCTIPGCPSQKVESVIDVANTKANARAKERSTVLGNVIGDLGSSKDLALAAVGLLAIVAILATIFFTTRKRK
jgi:cysteine-rich repeat protein